MGRPPIESTVEWTIERMGELLTFRCTNVEEAAHQAVISINIETRPIRIIKDDGGRSPSRLLSATRLER